MKNLAVITNESIETGGEELIRDYFNQLINDISLRSITILEFDILDQKQNIYIKEIERSFVETLKEIEALNVKAYLEKCTKKEVMLISDLFEKFCFLIENYYLPSDIEAINLDQDDEGGKKKIETIINKFDLGVLIITDEFISSQDIYDFKMTISLNMDNKHLLSHFFYIDPSYFIKNGGVPKAHIDSLIIEKLKSSKRENIFELTRKEIFTIKEFAVTNIGIKSIKPNLLRFTLFSLDISSNNIKEIAEDVFFCDDIYSESCSNCIKDTNVSLFLAKLKQIRLKHNKLFSIEPNTFQKLVNLTYLDVSGNLLVVLLSGCLDGLFNLETLKLHKCSIEKIEKDVFKDLCILKYVDLSNNEIETFDSETFGSLVNLEELNFSWNKIHMIEPSAFLNWMNLRKLLMAYNKLEFIYSDTFSNLSASLEILDLRCNKILLSTIESSSFKLKNLIKLNLSSIGLVSFNSINSDIIQFDTFEGLVNLEELNLSNLKIFNINPNSFFPLNKLVILDLKYNQIESLNPQAFNWLIYLESLDLSNNKISRLDSKIFYYLKCLKRLDLMSNEIEHMEEDSFFGLEFLENLILSNNKIEKVDKAFSNLRNLSDLDLSNNNLKYISSELFDGLISLRRLSLKGNKIFDIELNSFNSLYKLIFLDLYDNRIEVLNAEVLNCLTSLEELNLSSNKLENISTDMFYFLNKCARVYLTDSNGIPYQLKI